MKGSPATSCSASSCDAALKLISPADLSANGPPRTREGRLPPMCNVLGCHRLHAFRVALDEVDVRESAWLWLIGRCGLRGDCQRAPRADVSPLLVTGVLPVRPAG
jgi:hypothetical protein